MLAYWMCCTLHSGWFLLALNWQQHLETESFLWTKHKHENKLWAKQKVSSIPSSPNQIVWQHFVLVIQVVIQHQVQISSLASQGASGASIRRSDFYPPTNQSKGARPTTIRSSRDKCLELLYQLLLPRWHPLHHCSSSWPPSTWSSLQCIVMYLLILNDHHHYTKNEIFFTWLEYRILKKWLARA